MERMRENDYDQIVHQNVGLKDDESCERQDREGNSCTVLSTRIISKTTPRRQGGSSFCGAPEVHDHT